MNDLKAKYGDRLWLAHLDITDMPAIKQAVDKVFADPGGTRQPFQAGRFSMQAKWGVEGFFDSKMQELAPFNIGVTVIEPGGARTGFGSVGAQVGRKMAAYEGTPADMVHRILQDTSHLPPGDPAKMVKIMIERPAGAAGIWSHPPGSNRRSADYEAIHVKS